MERKSLTSILSSSLYFLPGCFMMLLILAVQSAKIRFYIEKAIFLFTFFDKSLVISRIFLNFATDSVSPFVWVSYLLVKDVYGTLSLSLKSRKFEYAQEENGNLERPRRLYCNLMCRADCCLIAINVFYILVYYNAS